MDLPCLAKQTASRETLEDRLVKLGIYVATYTRIILTYVGENVQEFKNMNIV